MPDDEHDDAEHALREAEAQVVSDQLQRRLFAVLNDPDMCWAKVPHCTAHGIAEVFANVLVALAITDPTDLVFGLKLIDEVRRQLIARAAPSLPGEILH